MTSTPTARVGARSGTESKADRKGTLPAILHYPRMTSIIRDRAGDYRKRAAEAREQAAAAASDEARAKLLQDADNWERMADYENANPTAANATYPSPDVA